MIIDMYRLSLFFLSPIEAYTSLHNTNSICNNVHDLEIENNKKSELTSGWDPGVKVTLLLYLKQKKNPVYTMCHVCSRLTLKLKWWCYSILICKKELECFIFAPYGFRSCIESRANLIVTTCSWCALASHRAAFGFLFAVPCNTYYYLTCLFCIFCVTLDWLVLPRKLKPSYIVDANSFFQFYSFFVFSLLLLSTRTTLSKVVMNSVHQ